MGDIADWSTEGWYDPDEEYPFHWEDNEYLYKVKKQDPKKLWEKILKNLKRKEKHERRKF